MFQPFACRLAEDGKSVEVVCRHYFRGAEAYSGTWKVYANGEVVASGNVDLSELGPQGRKVLPRPAVALDVAQRPGVTASIGYEICQREAEGAWPKRWVIAEDRLELPSRAPTQPYCPPKSPARFEETKEHIVFVAGGSHLSYAKETGELVSFRRNGKELFVKPMALDVFRAPTGIDMKTWAPDDGALNVTLAEGYREMVPTLVRLTRPVLSDGVYRFETEIVYRGRRREHATGVIRSPYQFSFEDLGPTTPDNGHYVVRNWWRIAGDGVVALDSTFQQRGNPVEPARLGWRFVFARENADVEWFGLGPQENYPDRSTAAFLGVWKAKASEFQLAYPRNQDSGSRCGTHAVRLDFADSNFEVATLGNPFPFMVSPYSPSELIFTSHFEDLPNPSKVELGVYARVAGVDRFDSQPDDTDERDIVRTDVPYRLSILFGGGRLVRREWAED